MITPLPPGLAERAAALVLAQIPGLSYTPHARAARAVVVDMLAIDLSTLDPTPRTLAALAAYCLGLHRDVRLVELDELDEGRKRAIAGLVWGLLAGDTEAVERWADGDRSGPSRLAERALETAATTAGKLERTCSAALALLADARVTHAYATNDVDGVAK